MKISKKPKFHENRSRRLTITAKKILKMSAMLNGRKYKTVIYTSLRFCTKYVHS